METLIEQYKKEQGNLPCKLAIACARPLTEAEVNCANNNNILLVIVLIRSKILGSITRHKICQ